MSPYWLPNKFTINQLTKNKWHAVNPGLLGPLGVWGSCPLCPVGKPALPTMCQPCANSLQVLQAEGKNSLVKSPADCWLSVARLATSTVVTAIIRIKKINKKWHHQFILTLNTKNKHFVQIVCFSLTGHTSSDAAMWKINDCWYVML